MTLKNKIAELEKKISNLGSVIVAFSGGVDSSFLLKKCADILGPKKVLAVIAASRTYLSSEKKQALQFAEKYGIQVKVIKTKEFLNEQFLKNTTHRCYYCKKELFLNLDIIRTKKQFAYVIDGTNYDDRLDYRPGNKAKQELKVISPLAACKFSKKDIRDASRKIKLKTFDKPSLACLASRVPYGTKITTQVLERVEKAEVFLMKNGFRNVRVRDHWPIARIEVDAKCIRKLGSLKLAKKTATFFKDCGYKYICVDLEGFRSGSMNL